MIPEKLLDDAEAFVRSQVEKYKAPSQAQVDIALRKAVELSEKLGANEDIVKLGALLMDCQLGIAIKQGNPKAHVTLAVEKTKELLNSYPEIDDKTRQNIISCVAEHHGAQKFSSLESEVVCNGDCYKFASVEGFLISVKTTRELPIAELVKLLSDKVVEKWNALSLETCKEELKPQYEVIKQLLTYLPK